MRIVHDNANAIEVRAQRVGRLRRPGEVTDQRYIGAAASIDEPGQMRRCPIASGQPRDLIAGSGKRLGDVRAKTFRSPRKRESRPGQSLDRWWLFSEHLQLGFSAVLGRWETRARGR